MKKVFLLIGCLALLIIGTISSCQKLESLGCVCDAWDGKFWDEGFIITKAYMNELNVSSCKDLANKLEVGEYGIGYKVVCKDFH